MQILNLHGPARHGVGAVRRRGGDHRRARDRRALRIPGLIGLLAGGCIIGPEVLGVVSDTTGILHELGEVGLLYLMFLAGLELDLGVFARYRNQAIGFTALTFLAPQILGTIGGLLVGYSVAGRDPARLAVRVVHARRLPDRAQHGPRRQPGRRRRRSGRRC